MRTLVLAVALALVIGACVESRRTRAAVPLRVTVVEAAHDGASLRGRLTVTPESDAVLISRDLLEGSAVSFSRLEACDGGAIEAGIADSFMMGPMVVVRPGETVERRLDLTISSRAVAPDCVKGSIRVSGRLLDGGVIIGEGAVTAILDHRIPTDEASACALTPRTWRCAVGPDGGVVIPCSVNLECPPGFLCVCKAPGCSWHEPLVVKGPTNFCIRRRSLIACWEDGGCGAELLTK